MPGRAQFEPLLVPLKGTERRLQYISLERAEVLGLCRTSQLP